MMFTIFHLTYIYYAVVLFSMQYRHKRSRKVKKYSIFLFTSNNTVCATSLINLLKVGRNYPTVYQVRFVPEFVNKNLLI